MEKGLKKKISVIYERTQPVQNESYHGYIASSDYYKCKPLEWKYMQGKANMNCLLTNEYQRMWIDEQQQWYDKTHTPKKDSVNIVKKYVTEFKDKVHPNVPRIDTRLCRMKKSSEELQKMTEKSKIKLKENVDKNMKLKTKESQKSAKVERGSKSSFKKDQSCGLDESERSKIKSLSQSNRSISGESGTHRTTRSQNDDKLNCIPQTVRSKVKEKQSTKEGQEINVDTGRSKSNRKIEPDKKDSSTIATSRSTARTIQSNRSFVKESESVMINEELNAGNYTDREILSKRNGLENDSKH